MIVTTQEELDAAIEAGESKIIVDSPAGVWLCVEGAAHVEARGSSCVIARESSYVVARDSSCVIARDSSYVVTWDSSSVVAWDSSEVMAWGSSDIFARGSSRVVARESATVEAWDSAHVVTWDSSEVIARDEAQVIARDSSYVEACGSSTVEARDSSCVEASRFTTVHLYSASATVTGGVVIDIAALDLTHITDWAEYHGVKVEGDEVIVYKAVDAELRSGRGFAYPIGETVECPDWKADAECGHGLHLSPSPTQGRDYFRQATRFLRCAVPVDELVVIDGKFTDIVPKLKAKIVRVICEVDVHGREIDLFMKEKNQ